MQTWYLASPLTPASVNIYHVPIDKATRACGIIERSWLYYAVQAHGSDTSVTAMNAEDDETVIVRPPYRFMVDVSTMLYAFLSFDADGMHLLDDELQRAYTFSP